MNAFIRSVSIACAVCVHYTPIVALVVCVCLHLHNLDIVDYLCLMRLSMSHIRVII